MELDYVFFKVLKMDISVKLSKITILMENRRKIVGIILVVIGLIILFIGAVPLLSSLVYSIFFGWYGADVSMAEILGYLIPTIIGAVLFLVGFVLLRPYFLKTKIPRKPPQSSWSYFCGIDGGLQRKLSVNRVCVEWQTIFKRSVLKLRSEMISIVLCWGCVPNYIFFILLFYFNIYLK